MKPKNAAFATAWIATVTGAFLLGGRLSHDDPTHGAVGRGAEEASASDERGKLVIGSAGRDSRAGSSPSSFAAGKSNGLGGSSSDRILRMLSGDAGSDWMRSDFESLAENLSLAEVQALIAEISTLDPGPAQRDAYQEVLNRWAELDAPSALVHVGGIDAPQFRRDATMNVLRHWSAVDPGAALAFATGEAARDLPSGSLASVFRGIGNSSDTSAALDFIASLGGSGHERDASSAISELFERNDEEVVEWASSLPAGELRNSSIQALARQWARYDPIAAKVWLDKNTDASNRPEALAALGDSWARSDPEEAVIWATGLSGSDEKSGGKILGNVMKRWIEHDLASAAGYLAEQEPSPALDGALERYIQRIKNVDPDATLAWAESISDPGRRASAVKSVAKILRSQDPAAFTDYVAASPDFSESERAKILGLEKPKPKPKKKDKKSDKKDKKKG